MQPENFIHWPAIVHYDNEAELAYVSGWRQWLDDADLSQFDYHSNDELIDSLGLVYALHLSKTSRVTPTATGVRKSLSDVLGLVKAHLAEQGSCCVAKLSTGSIAEALELVKTAPDCEIKGFKS
ncbi:MAG: DUF4144 family protein [Chromatiales bacterium]